MGSFGNLLGFLRVLIGNSLGPTRFMMIPRGKKSRCGLGTFSIDLASHGEALDFLWGCLTFKLWYLRCCNALMP